jgi:hypothetical protein
MVSVVGPLAAVSVVCSFAPKDGEAFSVSVYLDWAHGQSLSIRAESAPRGWPTQLNLVRTTRFSGQFASNLWEIDRSSGAPAEWIEHIYFDTIIAGDDSIADLIVRDDRLGRNQIVYPWMRAACAPASQARSS